MLKKIALDDLKLGAYVARYGDGSFNDPFIEVGKVVRSAAEIDELASLGVKHVYIDPDQGINIISYPPQRDPDIKKRFDYIAYREEMLVAEKHYAKALLYARGFMDLVRNGEKFEYRESLPMVENFLDSIYRNESAAVTLTTLRRYDEYTYTHCLNVGIVSMVFGKFLGLGRDQLRLLGIAGVHHDVGKAVIPEIILNKDGRLSSKEMEVMKTHAVEGYMVMRDQKGVQPEILRAVAEHHERFDGSGYPRGLSGDQIHQFARIISVVDVFDALASDRVYRKAIPPAAALGKMLLRRDEDFFPDYVELFIKCMGIYPVGSFVRINTGEYGVVCGNDSRVPLKPKVKLVFDDRMRPVKPEIVDLASEKYLSVPGKPEPKVEEYLRPSDYNVDVRSLLN